MYLTIFCRELFAKSWNRIVRKLKWLLLGTLTAVCLVFVTDNRLFWTLNCYSLRSGSSRFIPQQFCQNEQAAVVELQRRAWSTSTLDALSQEGEGRFRSFPSVQDAFKQQVR
uniref:Uncharacterized protein n=1 Tax=Trichuris muris TaxID=70415 RepID=A0A5S6QWL2_TRIMR